MARAETRKARIKALREEMDSIAHADSSYWRLGSQADREARADHQRRQERLSEIRKEIEAASNDE